MSREEPDNLPSPPQPEQQPQSPEPPLASVTGEPSAAALPKAYDPSVIERRWAEYWVRERLFEAPTPAPGDASRDTFTMLLPPPNVTGNLHMGHMFEHTESDIMVRWRRMCGDRAVWVPGTDHAGIATQMLVERQLADEGTTRKALGREAFTERVWEWKRQYGNAITGQMKRLGASVDWSREYFTMDERLNVAVREAFVRLYEQGLIYRGAYIVNWDPVQQTAVSDLEVTHEERMGKLYHIRYPFADGTGSIVVATTRPETMLGDVAVAVNPGDARYEEAIGKLLTLPLSAAAGHADREIPVLADEWANPEFGTGAVKVTPAHDPNDFAIGQRHSLPSITILDETAHVALPGSPYHGMDRFAAREKIVADLDAAGLLVEVRDHAMAIALSQRTRAVIEPRLSLQWFLAVSKAPAAGGESIAAKAIAAVKDGHIQFTPAMYEKTYMEWMTNIHDWCISRQLWWGHRIPAWHCGACGAITVARETPSACATCGDAHITQETDVLDTWFSSGLLPFTVFGWPNASEESQAVETIRETAKGEGRYIRQAGGAGNYAHVQLRISPNGRGGGFVFSNETDSHTLPERFIQPIQEGIQEAMRGGVVEGHPLVDIKVSLIGGSYHEVDSNDMAFRIAASIAFKEAARRATAVVLDPTSNLEISHVRGHGNLLTLEPRTSNLTPDLAAFYPTSLLVTGFDILFFWVARMIMFGCHFMLDVPMADGNARTLAEAVPFRHVYIHALVRDANREKMSKTKGNVVDPIEIIERFGTDAVRFTLASMASPGTDIAFSEARTEGYRAFANKIWNAARFIFMNMERAKLAGIALDLAQLEAELKLSVDSPIEDRWIIASLTKNAFLVNALLKEYRFDAAASVVYQFFWGDFCDWYLELVKLRLNFDDPLERPKTRASLLTLIFVFEYALRMLSPFMPFITEEIWNALHGGKPPAKSIALTHYPVSGRDDLASVAEYIDETIDRMTLLQILIDGTGSLPQFENGQQNGTKARDVAILQQLITSIRTLRKELAVPEKEPTAIRFHSAPEIVVLAESNAHILSKLARVSAIEIVSKPLTGNNARSTQAFDVAVLYERQIDVPAERERLSRDLAKYEKGLTAAERQLSNESFMAKAPAHIVEGLRKQAAETRTLYEKTKAALDALG